MGAVDGGKRGGVVKDGKDWGEEAGGNEMRDEGDG